MGAGGRAAACACALAIASCRPAPSRPPEAPIAPAKIALTSTSVRPGLPIPERHTCDGADVSPHLSWSGVPAGTKSLALVCDDPDAPGGTFTHWLVYGIPPSANELKEGQPPTPELPGGARQGRNDFGSTGYRGPCPPPGGPHRYRFTLFALDTDPALEPNATRSELDPAMEGHVLAAGRIEGVYSRRRR